MIRFLTFCFLLLSAQANADTLRLAVTTSFHNSGLSDVLLPEIKMDIGLDVQLLVVGTGQAIRLGEAGDVDAIMVHSRKAEDAFVKDGYGTHRREIMYNDFVFIGPVSDPANVGGAEASDTVLKRIFETQSSFVSRGDDSGTHKKERALWQAASLDPSAFAGWYKPVGSGMGASLNTASALNAYIMADRASWLNFGNKGGLKLLFSGDPKLFNQYAFIPVNPERHGHVKGQLAMQLEGWLTSPRAAALINGYAINAEQFVHLQRQALMRKNLPRANSVLKFVTL